MIILDSGLGGISVVRALRRAAPELTLTYVADTAGFPYGSRDTADINARAERMVRALTAQMPNNPVVLACNTLSTLCLEPLRAAFPTHFVGTVPAIKTAAQQSITRRFTLLATPNTASSDYSNALIAQFAGDCVVDSYGAPNLAAMAEAIMLGETIDDETLCAEISPAFFNDARGKTDSIVLGCTHYPLISAVLARLAPWPVTWIDSSEAIARRALSLPHTSPVRSMAYVTGEKDAPRYRRFFMREGFANMAVLALS